MKKSNTKDWHRILTGILPISIGVAMVSAVFIIHGCMHEPAAEFVRIDFDTSGNTSNDHPCDPDTVYFQNDILPIFLSSCAKSGCHDKQTAEDDVVLTDYKNIIETGKVRAYRPDNSDLYEVITETDPDKVMPPPGNPSLTSEQKALIRKWIEQGALNLKCDQPCDTNNVTYSGSIKPLLVKRCLNCHTGATPRGDISLTNYEDVFLKVENGGLVGVIEHKAGYTAMPYGGQKLPDCEIDLIRIWIRDGAKNN